MRQRDIISRRVLTNEKSSSSKLVDTKLVDTATSSTVIDSNQSFNIIRSGGNRRRIVITGVGIISPIGIGKVAFTQALREGKSGVDKIISFDPSSLACQIAAEVHDFDPSKYMNKKTIMRTGRSTQFAIAAAKMAVDDSGLDFLDEDRTKVGVLVGAATSGLEFAAKQHERFIEGNHQGHVSPYMGIIVFAGACSSEISVLFKLKGPSHTISTGCASGNDAVGYAYRFIRDGEADIMIAGGAEAPIVPIMVAGFASMRAVSKRNDDPSRASRPFDKGRDGFVLGEGAGILVFEEYEHAKARGVHIYSEVLGYGATNDAFHMSRPIPEGTEAIRAIQLALQNAGLEPNDIDYVNAHGSSTPLNDKTEAKIIRAIFGRHAYSDRFAVSSTKSMVGHAIGAASSMGLIASILASEESFIPPTINYEVPDPECDPDIDYVPNKAKQQHSQFILCNSFGLGGKNACLVIGKP